MEWYEDYIEAMSHLWRVYHSIELQTSVFKGIPRGFKHRPDLATYYFDIFTDFVGNAKIYIDLDVSHEEKRILLRKSRNRYRDKINNLGAVQDAMEKKTN